MAENSGGRFRIERLEERIAPSAWGCFGKSGGSGKHGGSGKNGGSKKGGSGKHGGSKKGGSGKHGGSKKGGSGKGCAPPPRLCPPRPCGW